MTYLLCALLGAGICWMVMRQRARTVVYLPVRDTPRRATPRAVVAAPEQPDPQPERDMEPLEPVMAYVPPAPVVELEAEPADECHRWAPSKCGTATRRVLADPTRTHLE